jgi:hypothetical protein
MRPSTIPSSLPHTQDTRIPARESNNQSRLYQFGDIYMVSAWHHGFNVQIYEDRGAWFLLVIDHSMSDSESPRVRAYSSKSVRIFSFCAWQCQFWKYSKRIVVLVT